MPADTLRVVTLNIWNNQGPWPERLRLIRRELGELQPDIVGLQEVLHLEPSESQPATPDQAQAIGDGFGYYSAFASAWHIGGGLQFGNALLSRWPIVHADNFQLPCEPEDETRGLLHCVLESPHGRISVFVTHLSWKLHQSDIRQQQVAFIAGKVRELAPIDDSHGFPPILMGDFNAEPESDEIRYLRGFNSRLGRSIYFADCFAAAGDGSPGYSYARANPYALRAHEPNRRLDYIFSRGPDRQLRGEPLSARLCFNQPVDGIWPTDHYGVLAEIQAAPRKLDPL